MVPLQAKELVRPRQQGTLLATYRNGNYVEYYHLGQQLVARYNDAPQQRYYDPVIGRFYSNDPEGFTAINPMMFNRYAYANNNPYRFTDPFGLTPESLFKDKKTYPLSLNGVVHFGQSMNMAASYTQAYISSREPIDLYRDISDVTTGAAITCAMFCQPAVPYLAGIATLSGFLAAATSDDPSRSFAVEVVTLGAARKLDAVASLAKGGFEIVGAAARGVDAGRIAGAEGINFAAHEITTIEAPPEEKERGQ